MFKRLFFLGILAGLLSGLACIIYAKVYYEALLADFSSIANPVSMLSACLFGCVLASVGYWLLHKWLKRKTDVVFNLLITVLSFVSILGPLAATLPLDMETDPSYFLGFAVPMHFFPALIWLALKPIFIPSSH